MTSCIINNELNYLNYCQNIHLEWLEFKSKIKCIMTKNEIEMSKNNRKQYRNAIKCINNLIKYPPTNNWER